MLIFEWILILLAGAIVLTAAARRFNFPYPSMLALGGVVLAVAWVVRAMVPEMPWGEERLDYAEVNAR